jgi:hypothetical protein
LNIKRQVRKAPLDRELLVEAIDEEVEGAKDQKVGRCSGGRGIRWRSEDSRDYDGCQGASPMDVS